MPYQDTCDDSNTLALLTLCLMPFNFSATETHGEVIVAEQFTTC